MARYLGECTRGLFGGIEKSQGPAHLRPGLAVVFAITRNRNHTDKLVVLVAVL